MSREKGKSKDINRIFLEHVEQNETDLIHEDLENSADPDANDGFALGFLCRKNNLTALDDLLRYGANVHLHKGRELLEAVGTGKGAVANMLLKHAPDLMRYEYKILETAADNVESKELLPALLNAYGFSTRAKNNALAIASLRPDKTNFFTLLNDGAVMTSRNMNEAQAGLLYNSWTSEIIKALEKSPGNRDFLFVAALLYDQNGIANSAIREGTKPHAALMNLEKILEHAPGHIHYAVNKITDKIVVHNNFHIKAKDPLVPTTRNEVLSALFNMTENPNIRNSIIHMMSTAPRDQKPTQQFVGDQTGDPFRLDY